MVTLMVVSRAVADSGITWGNPSKQDYGDEEAAKAAFQENRFLSRICG